jgi:diguanylate cyclase (GGDEF)-like protein
MYKDQEALNMVRSLKRLHIAALTGVFGCLLLAGIAGLLLFSELNGSLTRMVVFYVVLVFVALLGIAYINVALYRTIGAVRLDIRALVQMFNDVHQGSVRPDYPVAFNEFAVAQRYLRGWGRQLLVEKERLKDMGLVDHLSQLTNRRHFDARLKEIFDSTRTHGPSSVLMIDLDRFKQVNDQHGHNAGDALIVQFAAALRKNVRNTDVLARLGGDEFCIIFTHVPLPLANEFVTRLRRALPRELVLTPDARHELKWTGGLSVIQPSDARPEDVMWRADHALLRAKETGRNRTVIDDTADAPAITHNPEQRQASA